MPGTVFDNWPPQLAQAFIVTTAALLSALAVVATAAGFWVRSSLRSSAKKQEAEANRQALELAQFKAANEFVLEQAKRLSERVDKQDETIAQLREGKASDATKIQMLSDQLQEARVHSRDRDVKLGELQAKHDQAVQDRQTFESRVKQAIEERSVLEARVKELEDRQAARHEANEKMQVRISEIEHERDQAIADLRSANKRIAEFQERIRVQDARIATLEADISRLNAPVVPQPEPKAPTTTPPATSEGGAQ